MSLFLSFADGESKTLRLFESKEREYMSAHTKTKRWARRVLDREAAVMSLWTYAYPVKRAIDQALKSIERDLHPEHCDVRVRAHGKGRERRYEVEGIGSVILSARDSEIIARSSLTLEQCQ